MPVYRVDIRGVVAANTLNVEGLNNYILVVLSERIMGSYPSSSLDCERKNN